MAHRVAIYARISDDRTGEKAGVDRQLADARKLCKARGWSVVAELVDNDLTASRFAKKARPGYRQLVEMVEAGQVEGVAAYHTDRLYRQPKELEELIDLVEARGLLIGTCESDFDLGSSDGRAMARVLVAMAAKSSDDKSRRILRKHQALAAEGRVGGGGRRPFGFEPDRVTIREDEAALIREAADRILAGDTLRSVAFWLRSVSETSAGGEWLGVTVKRMLCSGRVAGWREHQGRWSAPAVWPAIITEDTSARVRAILNDPDRLKRGTGHSYLLLGLLHCTCGGRLQGRRTSKGKPRYICLVDRGGCNRCGISARLEDDVVAAALVAARDRRLALRRAGRLAATDEAALVDKIAATEARLAPLADDLAADRLGGDAYAAATAAIARRLDGLRSELARARAKQQVAILATDDPVATWETLTFDRKRAALAELIDRLTLEPSGREHNVYDPSRVKVKWSDDTVERLRLAS
jgi:site-specific DNA recombinase